MQNGVDHLLVVSQVILVTASVLGMYNLFVLY